MKLGKSKIKLCRVGTVIPPFFIYKVSDAGARTRHTPFPFLRGSIRLSPALSTSPPDLLILPPLPLYSLSSSHSGLICPPNIPQLISFSGSKTLHPGSAQKSPS